MSLTQQPHMLFAHMDSHLPMLFTHPGTQHFLLDMLMMFIANLNTKMVDRVLSQYLDFNQHKHKIDTARGAEAQLNEYKWKKLL